MFYEEKQERHVNCSRCGGEIYDPEPYALDAGQPVCEDCMNEDWQGQSRSETSKDMVNMARKVDFLINELGENAERLFSLSNAPMSLVAAYQRYLVRFVVEQGVPTTLPIYHYVDDMGDYIYASLIYKKCAVCGAPAQLHHVDRVGMGRDRTDIVHEGMEALPLCGEHHAEAHSMPDSEFLAKYHFDSGIALDKTLCRIYRVRARKEDK